MIDDHARTELLELERAMWRAETRYDPAFQEKHFAADFVEFGRSGEVYDRAQIIVDGGGPIDARLENARVRELAADTVLITYDSSVRRDAGTVEYGRRSSIWSRIDGVWQMRFHQGTPFVRSGSR